MASSLAGQFFYAAKLLACADKFVEYSVNIE
jgi:hypothetical protein